MCRNLRKRVLGPVEGEVLLLEDQQAETGISYEEGKGEDSGVSVDMTPPDLGSWLC